MTRPYELAHQLADVFRGEPWFVGVGVEQGNIVSLRVRNGVPLVLPAVIRGVSVRVTVVGVPVAGGESGGGK